MHISKLTALNFKNYEQIELEFSAQINCFVGNNGEGKTNVLDAIYYLSFCKSFFNAADSDNIKFNADFFVLEAEYQRLSETEKLYCGIKKGKKKSFKRNKKEYARLSQHIGLFPLVMVSPADSDLIHSGSDLRRKFIDGVIAQFDKEYLNQLLNYKKIMEQRNAYLKSAAENHSFDASFIEVYDVQLSSFGDSIHQKRLDFITNFTTTFNQYYHLISNGKEPVELKYISSLNNLPMLEALQQVQTKDRAATYTTVGIHKDDLEFLLNGQTLKKFGSQGQQKSYLLALKLAQYDFMKHKTNIDPILLLDDIFDKLDDNRVAALMKLVHENNFGQIFITDTHQERIAHILAPLNASYSLFSVQNQQITQKK